MTNLKKFREKRDPILAVQYKGDNIEEMLDLFRHFGVSLPEVFTNSVSVLFDSFDFGYLRVPIDGWLVSVDGHSVKVYSDKLFNKEFESY